LNHEESKTVDGEIVIDLEVTSNRGDCLGHIGVAREIAVLTGQKLKLPTIQFPSSATAASDLINVKIEMPEACPRYTARVIQGVKVGESPDWMQAALRSIGIGVVNNIVDVTNYVMMECGQPLHAFDAASVSGNQIVVRAGRSGEKLQAIDHRDYELNAQTCVIADANSPLAIAGVMGGASSEVTESTTNVIIEAADFMPLSVRRTARRLKLHSPSSFRFERRVDPRGIDWASRRACQLITEIAGGQVASGVVECGEPIADRPAVILRLSQLKRVLGIDIDAETITRILTGLGCRVDTAREISGMQCVPPSWRHDLTREADLIEEVARIHGYDKIPEDAPIPVMPSSKRPFDVAMSRVRGVLTAAGLSEAMTPSVVTEKIDVPLSPWTDRPAIQTRTAMLEGSRRLRRSLIPSLLQSRAANWAAASLHADLFEIAHVYLPSPQSGDQVDLPAETYHLGLIMGDDFFAAKGVIETLLIRLGIDGELQVESVQREGFAVGGVALLKVRSNESDEEIGYLGMLDETLVRSWKLPGKVVAAELSAEQLLQLSHLVPQQRAISPFPSIRRDLNLVLPESVRWDGLSSVIRAASDQRLTNLSYQETYRNAEQDGADRKRVLFSMELQSLTETLSGSDADEIVEKVVSACERQLSAVLMR
jgi:phenylalanyl-tRNA synthetase beta chain